MEGLKRKPKDEDDEEEEENDEASSDGDSSDESGKYLFFFLSWILICFSYLIVCLARLQKVRFLFK